MQEKGSGYVVFIASENTGESYEEESPDGDMIGSVRLLHPGKTLRKEVLSALTIYWLIDNQKSSSDYDPTETGLGILFQDIDLENVD